MNIHNNITSLIGQTPIVHLQKTQVQNNISGKLLAKLEYFNPAGSVKDRAAKFMIEMAEKKGLLKQGYTVIEPTSGNTGIGLAAVCAQRGYEIVLTMPESMSIERRKLLKAYGAKVVLTQAQLGMEGAVQKAKQLCEQTKNSFMPSQFENECNPYAHYCTTGPEIWRDTAENVDIFISAVGTGGTLSGTGKFLKEKNSNVKIIAVEPLTSALLSTGKAGAHKIQGIGANFIPKTLNTDIYDEIFTVSDDDAINTAKNLAKSEGFLVGISSGAALCAALSVAKRKENEGKTTVVILPDTGERYLSTQLFDE